MVILELNDAKIQMSVRYAIIHFILWQALFKFNIIPSLKHVAQDKIMNVDAHLNIMTEIYHTVIEQYTSDYDQKVLKKQLFDSIFDYHNFIVLQLGAYSKSISLTDLYAMMEDPQVKDIVDPPLKELAGTKGIELQIKQRSDMLFKLLKTPNALSVNPLHVFQQLDILNKDQLTQLLVAIGNRTDINDDVISYTIQSSLLKGLQNPLENAIDSLAGKKPIMYNKGSIKRSQYFGRKQHLVVSDLKYLYPYDCGTEHTVQFAINDHNKKFILGKNIVVDNQLMTLTSDNIERFVDTIVSFRSPLACKHNDGVCKVCAGKLIANQTPELHVGMNSSTQMVQEITQNILSAKHLTKTMSIVYKLPKEVEHCFISVKNQVFIANDFMKFLKNGYIGIHEGDIGVISDLTILDDNKVFTTEKYSKIRNISFKIQQQDEEDAIFTFPMISDQGSCPYLHLEFLKYMKSRYDTLKWDNGILWISMKNSTKYNNWDPHHPIFSSVIINDNMLAFVKRAETFLSKNIATYTTAHECLRDFSNLLYKKSSVNIAHLEMVLKAYTVTSTTDFAIPKNIDPDHISFKTVSFLLKKRSISGELSFESIYNFFTNPATYVVPSNKSIFDIYFNL
jgi:hypothetical protein